MTGNRIVKTKDLTNFNLTEAHYPPALRQPRHRHEAASLSFVVAGSYTETVEKKIRTCQPLTLILHPAGESHAVDFHSRPVRILNVSFDSVFRTRLGENSDLLNFPVSRRSKTLAALGTRLFREFSQPDALSPLAIEALVLEILVETTRLKNRETDKKTPRWLAPVKDCLHERFSEPVALEEIAAAAGVHPVHLARVFRRRFGCTIGEYVRGLRVEFARRKLSSTDAPLVEIALSAGFSDQSHLNKTFKTIVGLTPNEYRKFNRKS